jgi:hypothetical protein
MDQMRKGRFFGAALLALTVLAACAGQTIVIRLPDAGPSPTAAPRGYERLFSPAPHAFTAVAEPVRRGRQAERYELRAGDCGGSDCQAARARAEVVQNPDRITAQLNRDIWIGWSFRNGTIPAVTRGTWLGTVLGQWKLAGELPALFRLVQVAAADDNLAACPAPLCTQSGTVADDVMLELDDIAQARGWGPGQNNGRICRLFSLEAARTRWMDIVINTNFGTDTAGYLRVWVNGELRCNYNGALVSPEGLIAAGPGARPSHRRGIFNSYTERWTLTQGSTPRPTMVAWYDEFTTGLSRAEVDPAMLEAAGAAAVN